MSTIGLAIDAGIARITLNRPDKLNSFTAAMHEELQAAMTTIESFPQLRVLTITGAGRAFCAGQDLSDPIPVNENGKADLGHPVRNYYSPLIRRIRGLRIPVIAMVNGVAAGAGANIAFACDLVIAARSASFIQSFAKLGLMPDTGGTWILPRVAGMPRSLGLALLGDKLSAQQAADWGMIWKCVEDADLAATVEAIEQQLVNSGPLGLARTKEAIWGSGLKTLEEALELEGERMSELGFTGDFAEGVAAFKEKRPPRFTGK